MPDVLETVVLLGDPLAQATAVMMHRLPLPCAQQTVAQKDWPRTSRFVYLDQTEIRRQTSALVALQI